jgi:hypothetical protein
MILAPIDGREFARACRRRHKSPAPCRLPQLLRLLTLATLAGGFVFLALAPERAKAEAPTIFGEIAPL